MSEMCYDLSEKPNPHIMMVLDSAKLSKVC